MRTCSILFVSVLAACGNADDAATEADGGVQTSPRWLVSGDLSSFGCSPAPDSATMLVVEDIDRIPVIVGYEDLQCDPISAVGFAFELRCWWEGGYNIALTMDVDMYDLVGIARIPCGEWNEQGTARYDITVVVDEG